MKILITGACAVSARSVLRSLKKSPLFADATFVGWDMAGTLYGLYEGIFDRVYKVPGVGDPSYSEVVTRILATEKPDAVIVVPEVEVLYWAEHPFDVPHFVPPLAFAHLAISKKRLFDALDGTGLVPRSITERGNAILDEGYTSPLGYPVWIRDCADGTASGKGSFKAENLQELRAWVMINSGITQFQLSQFLPGGNYGCFCLFHNGELKKFAIAERIEYIMAKVAISGVTGNTAKGRLLNDEKIKSVALKTIDIICEKTDSVMNGLVVVDMKADDQGTPYVTEINIRHVAFSSSFANAGFNLSEAHLLCTLGRINEIQGGIEKIYPANNLLLRDVDGMPLYIEEPLMLHVGEAVCRDKIIKVS